ncbi:hypothetical protein FRB90_003183, partial [Tulasnella sp. 427]
TTIADGLLQHCDKSNAVWKASPALSQHTSTLHLRYLQPPKDCYKTSRVGLDESKFPVLRTTYVVEQIWVDRHVLKLSRNRSLKYLACRDVLNTVVDDIRDGVPYEFGYKSRN